MPTSTPTRDTPVFELFSFPERLEGVPLKVGHVHAHERGLVASVTDFTHSDDGPTFDIFIDMKPWAPLPHTRGGPQCFEVYSVHEDGRVNHDELIGLATREAVDVFTVKVTIRDAVHTLEMRKTGLQRRGRNGRFRGDWQPPTQRRRGWSDDRSYLLAH